MSILRNNLPNAVTALNLVCGTLAVVAAFTPAGALGLPGYQVAFIFIALGALADFLDGLVARALGAVSAIGAELDSLSDLVTFGLAPAMVLYNLLQPLHGAWALAAVMIPVCGALRLARFNVSTDQTTTFTGMPIPANAIFWIGACQWLAGHPGTPLWLIVAAVVALSLLMVSPLRMFSLKMHGFNWREHWPQATLLAAAVVLLATTGLPSLALTIILYVALAIVNS